MKRPFVIIGFTGFACLLLLNFFSDVNQAFIILVISAITGVLSLFGKNFRQAMTVPVFLFTAAFACLLFISAENDRNLAQSLIGDKVSVEATVSQSPYFKKDRGRYYCVLDMKKIAGEKANGKLRLSFSTEGDGIEKEMLEIGNKVSFTAKVYIPGEDTESISRYFTGEEIYLGAYGTESFSYSKPVIRSLNYYFDLIRNFVSDKFSYAFPDKIAGLLTSMLTGDKSILDDEVYSNFRISGAAHLLAVSGLHLSVWVFSLGSLIPESDRKSKIKFLFLLIAVVFIMLLAGLSESIKRAGFMSIIFLLGKLAGRKSDSINSLGLAVFIMIILNPTCVLSISLQLSFLSTLAILTIGLSVMKRTDEIFKTMLHSSPGRKALKICIDNFYISISVLLFTGYVLVKSFGGISTVTALSNIILVPLFTPLLFLSGIYIILSPISAVSYPLALIIKVISSLVIFITEKCALIPKAFLPFSSDTLPLYAVAVIIIIFLITVVLKRDLRNKVPFTLCILIICIAVISFYHIRSTPQIKLYFYNINSTLVTAIENNGEAVIYTDVSDYEKDIAVSNLDKEGVIVTSFIESSADSLRLYSFESGKTKERGRDINLFTDLTARENCSYTEFYIYGKYICKFHSQPLQYADGYDIIIVNPKSDTNKLELTLDGKSFLFEEGKGFVLTVKEDGEIILRGESSWLNLMKKG